MNVAYVQCSLVGKVMECKFYNSGTFADVAHLRTQAGNAFTIASSRSKLSSATR